MSELTITLADIRKHRPCSDGWAKLLASLGYAEGNYDPARRVSIGDVARSNGAGDALWCVRCLPETIEVRRVVVAMILPAVKRSSAHTTDQRVHNCISAVERWQAVDDTVDLRAASEPALEAREEAVRAKAAAGSAAAESAWATARAARTEAWAEAVAEAAAWAASSAAWAAANSNAERDQQVNDIIAVSPLVALA